MIDVDALTDERRNDLTRLFFRVHGFADHHARSMKAFVLRGIANIMNELGCNNERDLLWYSIGNVTTRTAKLRETDGTESVSNSNTCHVRQATFDIEVIGSLSIQTLDEHGNLRPPVRVDNILLFTLPMPHPHNNFKYCVRGQFRMPVMRDQRRLNEAYVYDSGLAEVRSQDHRERSSATLVLGIRSGKLVAILHVMGARIETLVSVALLLACYGLCDKDAQMSEISQGNPDIETVLTDVWGDESPDSIGEAREELTRQLGNEPHKAVRMLSSEILPHCSLARVLNTDSAQPCDAVYDECSPEKARFIAYTARRLILVHVLKQVPYDDKDDIGAHTLEAGGEMSLKSLRNVAASCIRQVKLHLVQDVKKKGPGIINPHYAFVVASSLQRAGYNARYGIAVGALGSRKQGSKNNGRTVADEVTPYAIISTLRTMRRSGFGDGGSGSVLKPRQMHRSEYCVYGPADSPDGAQIGLTKHLAMGTLVRCASFSFVHIMLLRELLRDEMEGDALVTFNGKEVCRVSSPQAALERLRSLQPNVVNPAMSCRVHEGRLKLWHDQGGIYRPLIASSDSEPFSDLPLLPHTQWTMEMLCGRVVFRDGPEIDTSVALSLKERDPSAAYEFAELNVASAGSLIDLIGTRFPHHCATSRVLYQDLMSKQGLGGSMGEIVSNDPTYAELCSPGSTQFLMYPERPLCAPFTEVIDELSSSNMMMLNFCILATHDNQEDSMVFSRGYVERGGGRAVMVQSHTETNVGRTKNGAFCKPESNHKFTGDYVMDKDGLTAPGSKVEKNDVFIGQQRHGKKGAVSDASTRNAIVGTSTVVDSLITTTPEGAETVKTRLATTLIPEVGDKFAYSNGQKGVLGGVWAQEDMPFGIDVHPDWFDDSDDDDFEPFNVDCIVNPMMQPSRTAPCSYAVMLGE